MKRKLEQVRRQLRQKLSRKLPTELCAEIETLCHDLKPVMKELKQKHPQRIPAMLICTRNAKYIKHLVRRYKEDLWSIAYERRGNSISYAVEVGQTDSLRKVKVYRYLRQPRWQPRRAVWREVGSLV